MVSDIRKWLQRFFAPWTRTVFLTASRPSTFALVVWKMQVSWLQVGVQLVSVKIQAPDVVDEEEPNQPRKGWQATVSRVAETQFWDGLLPTLSNRDVMMLRLQGGPLASIPFTVFPTDRSCRIDPQPFRVLLLRKIPPPAPFNCAFVCVWPSSRQLGPPPLGMLSCWNTWAQGLPSGDCSGPHLSRSRWKGADKRFPS